MATGVNFDTKEMAKERLRLPARMKGGGMKSVADKRCPTFLGALLDVLPRLIDRNAENGEVEVGCYSAHMTHIIGEGAYDADGHRNTQFLVATEVGPYPESMKRAWTRIRQEASINYGIEGKKGLDDWHKMGPLAETTLATVRNRGAAERKGRAEPHPTTTDVRRGSDDNRENRDRQMEREQPADMADMMAAMAEEREMEDVRATWAEVLNTTENEATETQSAGESREASGKTATDATQRKTNTERAVEVA